MVAALSTLPQMDREIAKMLIDRSRGQWKGELPTIIHRLGGLRQNRWEWSNAFRDEILGMAGECQCGQGRESLPSNVAAMPTLSSDRECHRTYRP